MGEYSGQSKRINGTKYYIVVNTGLLLRRVMIRDGLYKHSNNTLESSVVLKHSMDVSEQVSKTLDRQVRKREEIDRAADRIEEVYSDEW
jgi:hypothetical protein